MSIWILSLLVVASCVGLGLRQGVIRACFFLFGIIIATLLAAPLGHLLQPLVARCGCPNEVVAWMTAPLVAFIIIKVIFIAAGTYFHRQSEVHYKHQAIELEFNIWTRLNQRLGACIGLLIGAAYVVLLTFLISNLSYWTIQVAISDEESFTTRLVNRLGQDAQSTGLNKVANAVGTLPPTYYQLADLAGLLRQNPGLSARLARYPMVVSLLERDDVQQLINDGEFTNAWAARAPMGAMLKIGSVQATIKNQALLDLVQDIVLTNREDLTNFLATDKSPKYDSAVILGHWDFDVRVSFAYFKLNHANLKPPEMSAARNYMATAYNDTLLVVAGDHQSYMKFWPHPNPNAQPNQPIETISWKGSWTQDGTNYTFNLTSGSDTKTLAGTTDGQRLMLVDDKTTYVFDHEN